MNQKILLDYFDLLCAELELTVAILSENKGKNRNFINHVNVIKTSVYAVKDGVELNDKSNMYPFLKLQLNCLIEVEQFYSSSKKGIKNYVLKARLQKCKAIANLCDTAMLSLLLEIDDDYYRMISHINYALTEMSKTISY